MWAEAAEKIFKPLNVRTVSEHVDVYGYIPRGPEVGRWSTDRTPYLRQIMDAFTDPSVRQITLMCSAQVGKTSAMLNILQYLVEVEPCDILYVMPTESIARDFVKQRLEPKIRATPSLLQRFGRQYAANDARRHGRRKIEEELLSKPFPAGHVSFVGANSPAELASKAVRVVLLDEYDRMIDTREGDPLELARNRTENFYNAKIVIASTPNEIGRSKIIDEWNDSTQYRYAIPCSGCGVEMYWDRADLSWECAKNGAPKIETVKHTCPDCGHVIRQGRETPSADDLRGGYWVQQNKGARGKIAFHLNVLYSPWVELARVAERVESTRALNDPRRMREIEGTMWGRPHVPRRREKNLAETLLDRREKYAAEVPADAVVLTCAVDVQSDRLELETVGWGRGKESWGIEYVVITGDPKQRAVWTELRAYLEKEFEHESGKTIKIGKMLVDSGYLTDEVYRFCSEFVGPSSHLGASRVIASKGVPRSASNPEFIRRVRLAGNAPERCAAVNIDVSQAKDWLLDDWLSLSTPQPFFCHFPARGAAGYDREYFDKLMAEERDENKEWQKVRDRNEALDLRVYNIAAVELWNPAFDAWWEYFNAERVPAAVRRAPRGRRVASKGIRI